MLAQSCIRAASQECKGAIAALPPSGMVRRGLAKGELLLPIDIGLSKNRNIVANSY